MKAFRVKGSFQDLRQPQGRQIFSVEFSAEDAEAAKEKAVSTFGSKHKLRRARIAIDEIVEIPAEEITNPTVKYAVTGE